MTKEKTIDKLWEQSNHGTRREDVAAAYNAGAAAEREIIHNEKKMSENKWAHREDCDIIRPYSDHPARTPGLAVLVDASEGYMVFAVPETFSNSQVWECLKIANIAFAYGLEA